MAGEEEAAVARLYAARWPSGEPSCPWCGSKRVYSITTRRKHRCAAPRCRRDFSVLSGTPFASSKLTAADLLKIIDLFAKEDAPSINQIADRLGRQYKTIYVTARKVIEAAEGAAGEDILSVIFSAPRSESYRGYWQRRRRQFL